MAQAAWFPINDIALNLEDVGPRDFSTECASNILANSSLVKWRWN